MEHNGGVSNEKEHPVAIGGRHKRHECRSSKNNGFKTGRKLSELVVLTFVDDWSFVIEFCVFWYDEYHNGFGSALASLFNSCHVYHPSNNFPKGFSGKECGYTTMMAPVSDIALCANQRRIVENLTRNPRRLLNEIRNSHPNRSQRTANEITVTLTRRHA